jgi:hypothetical protein
MSVEKEGIQDMKEFVTILMDVKVSLAEQNAKLDSVLETVGDTKKKVEQTYDIAHSANNRSLENEKDIEKLYKELEKRADKQDVNKQNGVRNGLAVLAILISVVSALSAFLGQ